MQREVEAGFAETGDIAGLTAKYGELVLSKIACIVSDKDGKQKVRLFRDLRRSAVNARIPLQERLVLSRLSDIISASLDLMENGYDTEHLCFLMIQNATYSPGGETFLSRTGARDIFRVLHGILRSGHGAAGMVSCGGKHDEDHAGSTRHRHIPHT